MESNKLGTLVYVRQIKTVKEALDFTTEVIDRHHYTLEMSYTTLRAEIRDISTSKLRAVCASNTNGSLCVNFLFSENKYINFDKPVTIFELNLDMEDYSGEKFGYFRLEENGYVRVE